MENRRYLTVTAINRYLAAKIDSDINLKNMPIQGEISNARISKGHLYFVLKDENSEISAIMFQNNVASLNFKVSDGVKVIVKATLQLYEKRGTYSLIVTSMQEYGLGLLYQEFLKLKEKLAKEGLFDEAHKKLIPEYPMNIGVITSETADALHDIASTISKRFPLASLTLYPALVQGTDAPASLISAIKRMDKDNLDVCIIARGGGSFEDLSCFNDEELARTIYNANTPIVSGVGHEADYTICDFVSDFRAPTPTGAAVRVTHDKELLLKDLDNLKVKLTNSINNIIDGKIIKLEKATEKHYFKNFNEYLEKLEFNLASTIDRLNLNSPINKIDRFSDNLLHLEKRLKAINILKRIDDVKAYLEEDKRKLNVNFSNFINDKEIYLENNINKMVILNPLNLMKKGYSLVYKDDKLITSVDLVEIDDDVSIRLSDGNIKATIKEKRK